MTSPKRNQSPLIVIIGDTGLGKTNVGLLLGRLINPDFNIKKQVVWDLKQWETARTRLPPRSVLMNDEAIRTGNRRRVMSGDNVAMMTDANTKRKLRHVRIVIVPFADDLDRAQMKHAHWILKLDGIGKGAAYEVQKTGLQKTGVWWERRFRFNVPFLGDIDPEAQAVYDRLAYEYERGGSATPAADRLERFKSLAEAMAQRQEIAQD